MEMKSGYKQTDVGIIPEDWEEKPLGHVAGLEVGYAFRSAWFTEHDGVPLLRGENVGYGRLDWSETRRLPHKHAAPFAEYLLRSGDIVVGMDRTFTKSGTRISVLEKSDCPCLLVQRVGKFIPSRCDARFLWALLTSPTYQQALQVVQKGMDIPHLSRSDILHPRVPLSPTKAEQETIAEALSDADALIESLEQLIAKKRQIKQGAMQELLTGKKRLPGFSGQWEVKPLSALFNFSGGFAASREQLSTEGHCYLHYGDIHNSSKTYIDVQAEYQDIPKLDIPLKRISPASLLDDGDVVFVDASEDDEGTSKHVVIVNKDKTPYISGLHTIVATTKTNYLDHLYKRYCFQTAAIKKQFYFFAVATKVSGISKTNIGKVTIPMPSFPEQEAIAEILSGMDAEIAALKEKLAKAREIKQGMMQELLTGRIRLI